MRLLERPDVCPPDEERFGRFTKLARLTLNAPVALVSLVDGESHFFSTTDLPESWASEQATLLTLCAEVVESGERLVVTRGAVGYAGVPLVSADGPVLGAFCAVDSELREWTKEELEILVTLADAVSARMQLLASTERAGRLVEDKQAILESPLDCILVMGLTERVRAEEALQAAEERYRSLIENIPLATYMHSVEVPFRSLYVSPQIEAMLGYTPEEWAARPELATEGIHPDDCDRVAELAREARANGVATRSEFRFRARDGRTVWVLDHTIPVRDADGRTICHQGFLLDITEQKQLEEQLRQSQKMEAIGQLAGGIAHDFNNMLTGISGYADLLAHSFDAGDPRVEDVEQIRKAAAHAAALTRQLLAFGRKQMLRPQRLDVNDVVRDLEKMLTRTIGCEVELEVSLADGLAPVESDPDQLVQVILNIALNGRDAMPHGGRLTLATRSVESGADRYVAVEVTDTGTGIDEHVRNRLFEPFFTTKDQGKGTGLGLATAYGVVSQSGGRIEVETALGAGSTFRVLLPAAA